MNQPKSDLHMGPKAPPKVISHETPKNKKHTNKQGFTNMGSTLPVVWGKSLAIALHSLGKPRLPKTEMAVGQNPNRTPVNIPIQPLK